MHRRKPHQMLHVFAGDKKFRSTRAVSGSNRYWTCPQVCPRLEGTRDHLRLAGINPEPYHVVPLRRLLCLSVAPSSQEQEDGKYQNPVSPGLRLLPLVPPLAQAPEQAVSLAQDPARERPHVGRARPQPLPQTWPQPTCDSVEVGNSMRYPPQHTPGTLACPSCTRQSQHQSIYETSLRCANLP